MASERDVVVVKRTGEIIERAPTPLMVSPDYIRQQEQSLALLRQLTKNVLKKGRDYGTVPGVPGDFLWDPGASTIIGAFKCHPGERRILNLRDDSEIIAVVMEVPLIQFDTGQEVGSGIGAASTKETKHKYRWVDDPIDWGYNEDTLKTLKTKQEYGRLRFRIPNPEHGELLNTIIKMASKRAEVDGAQGLPGVGSALKELFDPKQQQTRPEPDWAGFWGKIAQMGLAEDDVHRLLKVKSVTDWIIQGKTLEQAIKVIAKGLADEEPPSEPGREPAAGPEVARNPQPDRDPETIQTLQQLYQACFDDFGLQPGGVVKDTGVGTQSEMLTGKTPADIYREIASIRK